MHDATSDKLAVPVSQLRRQTTEGIKAHLAVGPLLLTQRGKVVAVLLDPALWCRLLQARDAA